LGNINTRLTTHDQLVGEGRRGSGMKMMEIVKFSCPYGRISHRRDILERVYEEKKQKYAKREIEKGRSTSDSGDYLVDESNF
jgi:hypothetical protein